MKKLYFSIVALFMGVIAFAQAPLYATGDFEASNWSPEAPVEFTFAAGKYSIDIQGVSMLKISLTKGTWDDFNAGCLTANDVKNGEVAALNEGDANILLPWKGDYHLVVDLNAKTLVATTNTPNPDAGGFTKVYIRGAMNGWGTDSEWMFSTNDGETYTIESIQIEKGVEFKIADANWGKINYGGVADMSVYTDYELNYNDSKNCTVAATNNYKVIFTLSTHKVRFEMGAGVEGIEVENAASTYYNLQGVQMSEDNLAPGLYIRVNGNKASKVLVK